MLITWSPPKPESSNSLTPNPNPQTLKPEGFGFLGFRGLGIAHSPEVADAVVDVDHLVATRCREVPDRTGEFIINQAPPEKLAQCVRCSCPPVEGLETCCISLACQPALSAGPNRLFQVLDLYWRAPESGDVRYTSRQLKNRV